MRVLAQQAKRTQRLLEELEELAGDCAEGSCAVSPSGARSGIAADCPRCALAALLSRFRDGTY
ncbi:hypothetical protein [Streptomyces sp. NPDC051684]|uniref:hypothetical protein n=1 Tax=Streptomyces sp. NPDC051684 TaxID=3365670 RepID=UPI00379451DD